MSRKFYDFENLNQNHESNNTDEHLDELYDYVHNNIIGSNAVFLSPYGPRKVIYCDYTASGRSLSFIEDYINTQVLPSYGSTHTTTSVTALQTTLYRHEARDIIRNAVKASEHDRIIFGGSGTTGVINKLLQCLKFKEPPIIFTDTFSHHSSLLPLRHIAHKVICIQETKEGLLDLESLENELIKYDNDSKPKLGFFTAASNITGIFVDDIAVTIILHRYHVLSFWDYATAAPYTDIIMNPITEDGPNGLAHKDAIFFSLHKFVGGVQTPGVMIAKNFLFQNEIPSEIGGGTVFFVSRSSHRYLKNIEEREEGGTPSIVEAIRGGMVMQLKMNLNPRIIMEKNLILSSKIALFVKKVPELIPLGNVDVIKRLPILSFVVIHKESGKFLHHNFVSSLLNDMYGIQSRSGCACAGPYALDLLGIDEELAEKLENALLEEPTLDRTHLRRKEEHGNVEVLRPGFTRINIPFTSTDEQVNYIFDAIQGVCTFGWKLLPQYIMNPETGEWKHHTNLVFKERQWLQNISYSNGKFCANLKPTPKIAPQFSHCLQEAENIFAASVKTAQRMTCPDQAILFTGSCNELRWFLLPHEAKQLLITNQITHTKVVFKPLKYPLSKDIYRNTYVWINYESGSVNNIQKSHMNSTDNKFNSQSQQKEQQSTVLTCRPKLKRDIVQNPVPKAKWMVPTKNIFNPTVSAIQNLHMIVNGDRIMVCLSGGKDSLSLLHTLKQYQYYSASYGVKFDLGAVTVDPQSSSYDPRPLIPYLASLNVPYFYEEQGILKQALELSELNSICSFCSRMKRGRIYFAARREGYNVLAFGQHLDDLSESFLMSVFHNGRLRTMKASYDVEEGDLRVIRPFVYVREKDLRQFAESRKLPIIAENCPACFEAPKERHRMKQLLAQQEVIFPRLFWSLKTAMMPLLSINKTGMENKLFGKIDYKMTIDAE